jgi:purine-nucleoside phosphorylase
MDREWKECKTGPGHTMRDTDAVLAAMRHLSDVLPSSPEVAVILGSGLGGLADRLEGATPLRYEEIPGFAPATVAGHRGRLIAGRLGGKDVVVFQGRFHVYEGHDLETVVLPARLAAALGADTLIVTAASGGVNPGYGPGTLMLISDHLNLMGRNPLLGPVREGEARFPDLSRAYDPKLRSLALEVAREESIDLVEGVYAAVLGPSYETPAEVRMIERLGGDAVGMSTVPEVIAARAAGLRVLGLTLVTNAAAGLGDALLDHEEVVAAGQAAAERFERLVSQIVSRL